jgi:hypothetical protein
MISNIDDMQSFDYGNEMDNTLNSMMDKMMTDDLVVEQYYGRPLDDIPESDDRDSFETQMIILDEESKSVFEKTFDEYDVF